MFPDFSVWILNLTCEHILTASQKIINNFLFTITFTKDNNYKLSFERSVTVALLGLGREKRRTTKDVGIIISLVLYNLKDKQSKMFTVFTLLFHTFRAALKPSPSGPRGCLITTIVLPPLADSSILIVFNLETNLSGLFEELEWNNKTIH